MILNVYDCLRYKYFHILFYYYITHDTHFINFDTFSYITDIFDADLITIE
jgi:hypothetical protein